MELYVHKSTSAYAAGHQGDAPLDGEPTGNPAKIVGPWRVSPFCAGNGACVQIAPLAAGGRAIRDSKLGADGPVLKFSEQEWRAFVEGIKADSL